ncbi:hypothetical protein ACMC56_05555 [Campylobacterota bacterium DY0563]
MITNNNLAKDLLETYQSYKSNGLLLQAEQDYIHRILDKTKPLEEIPLAMQRSFNIYNLYAHYAIEVLDDEKLFLENLAIAGEYAKYTIKFVKEYPKKFQTVEPFNQNQLFHTLCFLVIIGWIDEAKEYAKFIGDNLEKLVDIENRLLMPQFWFVLKLLNNDFTTNLQVITFPYDKYKEYDNGTFIKLLLELKTENLKLNHLHIVYDIFPYEVLVYIKLMNIKEVNTTHPFIKTKIVQTLLQFEKRDSVDVKNINELLDKFFYEATSKETKQEFQAKIVPKTGHYQATLPKEHPQYKSLKNNPQAYHTYKEGKQFLLTGLEEYETNKIQWVFVE